MEDTGLRRRVEGLGDLRVHLDGEALFDYGLLVALLHLLRDPVCEGVAEDSGADVADPGLRDLEDLLAVGQIGLSIGVLPHEVGDVLEGQALVLRYGDVADLVAVDGFLGAADQVFEEVLLKGWGEQRAEDCTYYGYLLIRG